MFPFLSYGFDGSAKLRLQTNRGIGFICYANEQEAAKTKSTLETLFNGVRVFTDPFPYFEIERAQKEEWDKKIYTQNQRKQAP